MKERDKQLLKKRSVALCKELVVDELLIQSLQADNILTESMAESILVRIFFLTFSPYQCVQMCSNVIPCQNL